MPHDMMLFHGHKLRNGLFFEWLDSKNHWRFFFHLKSHHNALRDSPFLLLLVGPPPPSACSPRISTEHAKTSKHRWINSIVSQSPVNYGIIPGYCRSLGKIEVAPAEEVTVDACGRRRRRQNNDLVTDRLCYQHLYTKLKGFFPLPLPER